MRKLVVAAVAVVVLIAAWWAYALSGAAALASAASHGDVAAVARRVDIPALIRSLGAQIARAALEDNPQFAKLSAIERRFVGAAGAGAAEALLREALTPETLAALLGRGRIGLPGAAADWRAPALGEVFGDGPWRAVANSRFEGPLSFVVRLDGPDGGYDVHLHLDGTTWRLDGLDLPKAISAGLARAISERVGEGRGG
ncbi:DUF2939 family protein [Roseiarcus fermentans]|uniref:DUF2939 family protein n=1 Tax=Roseiarcus fermentans TaxID=1473586 RepID=A0A366EF70_9HYPH|nr:DUF2939 domain-containing protein [Roseiarcus fermentans]RBP01054.1 DUF2939 family protein [Roseiarcus fermentans]